MMLWWFHKDTQHQNTEATDGKDRTPPTIRQPGPGRRPGRRPTPSPRKPRTTVPAGRPPLARHVLVPRRHLSGLSPPGPQRREDPAKGRRRRLRTPQCARSPAIPAARRRGHLPESAALARPLRLLPGPQTPARGRPASRPAPGGGPTRGRRARRRSLAGPPRLDGRRLQREHARHARQRGQESFLRFLGGFAGRAGCLRGRPRGRSVDSRPSFRTVRTSHGPWP